MLSVLVSLLVIASIGLVIAPAPAPACNENKGSIWTTNNDCGNETQDENQYAIGGKVFINGKNFECLNYNWSITGQPGGASEDPGIIVASGNKTVNPDGSFCFEAYTVQADDGGVYSVDFGNKNDNYRVNENLPVVPEFGTTVGILTALSAVGMFFLVRRK